MVKVTTVRDLDSSKRTKPKIGEILFDETNGNIFLSVKVGKETKIINLISTLNQLHQSLRSQ